MDVSFPQSFATPLKCRVKAASVLVLAIKARIKVLNYFEVLEKNFKRPKPIR